MNANQLLRRCRSWAEFRVCVGPLSRQEKGACFEVLVRHFLELHPKYATQLAHVWQLKHVPAEIRSRLSLPAPDEGIDLIAETMEGGYWAIQCKYREDETLSLGRDELSTFTDLAFGICKNIELGLVCTTYDRFSYKLALYGERLSLCAGDVWRSLDEEFFQRLHSLLDGNAVSIASSVPRPHQQRAIEDAYTHFVTEGNARGKLIMPCGTGKSLAAYWIAEKLEARTILVAVPSLALVHQSLEVWTREALARQRDIHWIVVCSDESVGDVERDDVAVLTQDLGIRIHTNSHEIATWLGERRGGTTVVFTTYQSGPATAEAARKAGIIFDVGVMDEAHKTVGRKGNLFGHLLHEESIGIAKRLFMTATERYYRGNSDDIASMDDPDLYGDTFHVLSFKSALEAQPPILTDYKLITIGVTRAEVAALIERNAFVRPDRGRWNDDIEAEMLAAAIALRKAMQTYPIRHAVSFHQSIARARLFKDNIDAFSTAFPEYGSLATFHVAGTTPTAVRSRILDEFATTERGLVTNARCLTEGVDVPDIDCVLFADPKRSSIDIVQSVGRALRRADDKQFGYIVVPVLLGEREQHNSNTFEQSPFYAVLTVLQAIAANDDRIVEYFRTIAEGKKTRGKTNIFEIKIPAGMLIDAQQFVESIELRMWPKLAKLSWRPFIDAKIFAHGLGLETQFDWARYCHGEFPEKGSLPIDIPARPNAVYNDSGWRTWGDWLGSGVVPSRRYRSFARAREFARGLGLKSDDEWGRFCRGELPEKRMLPDNIPILPHDVYKDKGWLNWDDWLGTNAAPTLAEAQRIAVERSRPLAAEEVVPSRRYRSFARAREFARGLGLTSDDEWGRFCRGELPENGTLPEDIPALPRDVYTDSEWTSWGDWLNAYRSFEQAREFARGLGLKSDNEWRQFCRGDLPEKGTLPEDVPALPQDVYKDSGWMGFQDWLNPYRPFEQAREYARGLGLTSDDEWRRFIRGQMPERGMLPDNIPVLPHDVYKDRGWLSWGDWLGTAKAGAERFHT